VRNLKDHLHEKHGLDVEAYEIGARAGLTIKEVLNEMLTTSSFAVLVMTGEDLDAEGHLHARENVIHELGLFQGRLGWRKAIALLEEGVEEFSNIHGLIQIRFNKGNIRETFGEVLATIKREFSEKE
jgi:predicted nucleotide-binding protein